MLTPAPALLPTLTLADRFWTYGAGTGIEPDEAPEPLRSVLCVRQFLAALDRLDATSPRKAAAALVAMLRQAELEGDLSYASPEQVRGEILDTRSVVFSLGVVLFERITGRHPFGAENNRPRRIDRIRKGELGSGVNSFPTVSAGLRSVLVRAMSPFSEERWPDLRQMRELLGQFIAQESPAPRLPGTDAPTEDTRVVRLATEFGRELMQVVASNEKPTARLPRLAIPTAGIASVTGANAAPGSQRRAPQATPRAGTPRPPPPSPEPSSDSVVTRIHIDPLAATMQMAVDEVKIAERRAKTATEPPPVPRAVVVAPGHREVDAAAFASQTPRRSGLGPTPSTPTRLAAVPRSPAETRAALAAPLAVLPPQPSPPPSFELPLPAPPDSIALVPPPPSRRGRALVLGAIGAVVGGSVALALFFALGSSPPASTAASIVTSPSSPAPPPTLSPPAVIPSEPTPAAPPSPPEPTLEDRVAALVAPCVTHNAKFGLSLLFRYGVVSKPYYASGDGLTPVEHGCITKAIRGASLPDAPTSSVLELKVRVTSGAATVTRWR